MRSLPPGEYFLAAVDADALAAVDAGASGSVEGRLDDPALLESLAIGASRVAIAEGQRVMVVLGVAR